MEYDKKFIIIGNLNAITYKETFPLLKENKMWLGYGFKRGNAYFYVSPNIGEQFVRGVYDKATGLVKFRNVVWYTNIDIQKRHEDIILYRTYDEESYPKYDNYDAINVDKTKDIPCDYYEVMGVPITFMDKYNPDQFNLLGLDKDFTYDKGRFKLTENNKQRTLYARLVIKRKGAAV